MNEILHNINSNQPQHNNLNPVGWIDFLSNAWMNRKVKTIYPIWGDIVTVCKELQTPESYFPPDVFCPHASRNTIKKVVLL